MRSRPASRSAWAGLLALGVVACTSEPIASPSPTPDEAPPAATPTATATPEGSPAGDPTATPAIETTVGDAWERLEEAPVALTEVAATTHEERVWVAGGLAADGFASSGVLIFDPAAGWSDGPPLPAGLHHAVLVSADGRLHLLGGYLGPGFGQPTDQVWILDEGADRWVAGPSLPEPRAAGAAAWDGGRLLFAGGVGPAGVVATVYALAEDRWAEIGAMEEPREHLAATSDGDGRTWLLGGRRGGLDTNVGHVELIAHDEVRRLDANLTPRSGVGAFWLEGLGACLVGGEGPGGTLHEVECVTEEAEVAELPSLTAPRHGLGVALLGDGVYALLGGEQPGLFVSSVVERLAVSR